jgi:molybdopterin/thiamine biosynthesis adenylyltransferase
LLEPVNIPRHEGDMFDVGKYKVHFAAERVYRINPAITLETYAENIFNRPLEEVRRILNGNLIVAATDKQAVQLLINEMAHRFKIPCVFGGCYEEALGGEVLFTLPDYKMPCLCCLRGGLRQPDRSREIDYSTATGPEDYQAEPGLHAAIDFVTCVEVIECLAILLRKHPGSKLARIINPRLNFILIGGPLAKGFYRFKRPFEILFQPLSGPRKDCIVCQSKKPWPGK